MTRILVAPRAFSKDWKVNPALFPGLGKFRLLFSKPWKTAGSGTQTGRADIFCGTSAADALLFRRDLVVGLEVFMGQRAMLLMVVVYCAGAAAEPRQRLLARPGPVTSPENLAGPVVHAQVYQTSA